MPLTFDLPLEELYAYQGRNPRPADFDQYWDNALQEMEAVEPNIELVPADFKTAVADCFHLYFTGVGGARVHAKLLKPKTVGPHPAVLMFHGYSLNSGNWLEKLGYVAEGFVVAVLDCRGQGGLSEDVGGVVGNTLNGHIIRGLDGPPEKDTVPADIFRYGPTGKNCHGNARCRRDKGCRHGSKSGWCANFGLRSFATQNQISLANLSVFI